MAITYNFSLNFWIKKIPEYQSVREFMTLDDAIEVLLKIANREVTGNLAIGYLHDCLENLSRDDATVLERIVGRDLRCGISDKTINKVWKGLIPVFPVMLCQASKTDLIKKLKFPQMVQEKMDGGRILVVVWDGEVSYHSRTGNAIDLKGLFDDEIKQMANGEAIVYDGELIAFDGNIILRQESNGLFTKAIRGTISNTELAKFRLYLWDRISHQDYFNGYCGIPYKDRYNQLKTDYTQSSKISIVDSQWGYDLNEIFDDYQSFIDKGSEGIIVKDPNAPFENKRVKHQIKFKQDLDIDLKVVEEKEGTGKYQGMLGAIRCETADGKLSVWVGTGFKDLEREESYLDRVVTVGYNTVIQDFQGDYSLFLPKFKGVRLDKTIANLFEDLE